jgi:hypothetical protein
MLFAELYKTTYFQDENVVLKFQLVITKIMNAIQTNVQDSDTI